jgi:hypothetical protein
MLERQTSMQSRNRHAEQACALRVAAEFANIPETASLLTSAASTIDHLADMLAAAEMRAGLYAERADDAKTRLVYANEQADAEVRAMRERSNARADALRLLGWDGETDPVKWAKAYRKSPVAIMSCSATRFRELSAAANTIIDGAPNLALGLHGILRTAVNVFDLLGAGATIVADKETP